MNLETLPPFAREIIEIQRELDAVYEKCGKVIPISIARRLQQLIHRKRVLVRYGFLYCRPMGNGTTA